MQKVKLLLVTFGILAVGMLGISPTVSFAQVVTNNSMSILGTCGITIDNALSFGNVTPGEESGYEQLDITPTGNGDVVLLMYASNWVDGDSNNIIDGDKTRVSNVNTTPYADALPMNSTDGSKSFGTLVNSAGTNSTYWLVDATLNTGFVGSVQQDMTFMVNDCV